MFLLLLPSNSDPERRNMTPNPKTRNGYQGMSQEVCSETQALGSFIPQMRTRMTKMKSCCCCFFFLLMILMNNYEHYTRKIVAL